MGVGGKVLWVRALRGKAGLFDVVGQVGDYPVGVWSVPEKVEAWFLGREFVDVSIS